MRMLGKRFVKRNVSRVVTDQREMRDAILWEVHPEDRLAYVRVQGSNENVVAFYPRHWTTLPVYMKVGTSVRIVHIGGVNKMEISGQGLTIPTPVTGPQYPPLVGGGNGVLTGMGIGPTTPGSLTVTVEEGTYRIGGVTYGLDSEGVVLGDDILLGINIILGTLADSVTFDAPPVTGFRYDAIVVGTDGVLDYIKGVEASSNPQKPAIPGAHILVGDYVLMYGA